MRLVKKDRLPASCCGADVKLSVEGAFRIVEDMVTELMGDQHIDGVTCMREYGGMWVFVRNRLEMPEQLGWMDDYTVTSYISSFSRIRLYIDTIIERADGTVCLKSRLELCAVDLETGKIRKTETVGVGDKTPPECPLFDISYSKEKPVKTDIIDEIVVRSTDIDYCRHTNNISYVRYFMNQYRIEDLIDHPVRSIEVQYAAQTHEGDKLELYRCDTENEEAYVIELDGSRVVSCIIGH
jgi:acyl-CoA thioesterase FadM